MLAGIITLFRSSANESDPVRLEWERLLATASSPRERDEINDVFGRVAA